MAQDDYFVIVYKLLKYLYDCLKKGTKASEEILTPEFFGINEDYWEYIIRNLYQEGYVDGGNGTTVGVYRITENGYIEIANRNTK